MKTWQLVNADELAAEFKYTFYKPSPQNIQKVVAGEVVKLIFKFDSDEPDAPGAERMWVLVDEVLPSGRFCGRLDNDPYYIKDLVSGEFIQFEACHIIATEHSEPDNIVERFASRCFVTHRVLYDGAQVGYLYREEPDSEDDSGWRITSNQETAAYMEDSANSSFVSLGAVLNRDDSFIALLESPAGSSFVRDTETGSFIPSR